VTDELPVHVSREELHALEVPASFEAEGSFSIRLVNHAESLHVHLHLDDPLSEFASIDASNHYVEGESERLVRVDVDADRLDGEVVRGKVKVASAYGAETRWVDVQLREPTPEETTVQVDESLSEPQPMQSEPEPLVASPGLLVAGLGIVALGIVGVVAVTLSDPLIAGGALVVLTGVVVALFFLLQDR
jgi:hypothetical protein